MFPNVCLPPPSTRRVHSFDGNSCTAVKRVTLVENSSAWARITLHTRNGPVFRKRVAAISSMWCEDGAFLQPYIRFACNRANASFTLHVDCPQLAANEGILCFIESTLYNESGYAELTAYYDIVRSEAGHGHTFQNGYVRDPVCDVFIRYVPSPGQHVYAQIPRHRLHLGQVKHHSHRQMRAIVGRSPNDDIPELKPEVPIVDKKPKREVGTMCKRNSDTSASTAAPNSKFAVALGVQKRKEALTYKKEQLVGTYVDLKASEFFRTNGIKRDMKTSRFLEIYVVKSQTKPEKRRRRKRNQPHKRQPVQKTQSAKGAANGSRR